MDRRSFPDLFARALLTAVRPRRRLETTRLWEVDAWRGIAVCMMLVYHFVWDLEDIGGYSIDASAGFWSYWQMATAGLFTLLVGVSLALSYQRGSTTLPGVSAAARTVARGAAIFVWGMVVSLVTYLVFGPERFVRFGILHLIGVAIILAYPLVRHRWLSLALGVATIGLGAFLDTLYLNIRWLLWLLPTAGTGVDHQPLLPMLGPVLIGVFIGRSLFPEGNRRFRVPDWAGRRPVKVLRYLGQSSLLIYLLHQPVLVGLFLLLGVGDWPLGAAADTS